MTLHKLVCFTGTYRLVLVTIVQSSKSDLVDLNTAGHHNHNAL